LAPALFIADMTPIAKVLIGGISPLLVAGGRASQAGRTRRALRKVRREWWP
jgi:hypothetical protein